MTACPTWCSRNPDNHPDAEGITVHSVTVGMVELVQELGAAAYIILPSLRDVTLAQARTLAGDLLLALGLPGVTT